MLPPSLMTFFVSAICNWCYFSFQFVCCMGGWKEIHGTELCSAPWLVDIIILSSPIFQSRHSHWSHIQHLVEGQHHQSVNKESTISQSHFFILKIWPKNDWWFILTPTLLRVSYKIITLNKRKTIYRSETLYSHILRLEMTWAENQEKFQVTFLDTL